MNIWIDEKEEEPLCSQFSGWGQGSLKYRYYTDRFGRCFGAEIGLKFLRKYYIHFLDMLSDPISFLPANGSLLWKHLNSIFESTSPATTWVNMEISFLWILRKVRLPNNNIEILLLTKGFYQLLNVRLGFILSMPL